MVSDTHGETDGLRLVLGKLGRTVQGLIHLGDGAADAFGLIGVPLPPLYQVRGNVDADWSLPPVRTIWALDRKLLAAHGHHYIEGTSFRPFVVAAQREKACAFLFGHTHVPFCSEQGGVLLLNPGSLSRPRGRWGPSFAVIDVSPEGEGWIDVRLFELVGCGTKTRFLALHPA